MNTVRTLTAFALGTLGLSTVLIAATATEPQPAQKCEWGSPCWFESWDSLFERSNRGAELPNRSLSRMSEDAKNYRISVDLPGVVKKEIDLQVIGHRIVLTAQRQDESRSKEGSERSVSRFQQSYLLPEDADLDHISATAENGVLDITVPKTGKAVTRKITVH